MPDLADPRGVLRVLLYGGPESRRGLAEDLRGADADAARRLLAETVRAPGPPLLRARCLEALAVAAAAGDEGDAEAILSSLLGP